MGYSAARTVAVSGKGEVPHPPGLLCERAYRDLSWVVVSGDFLVWKFEAWSVVFYRNG